MSQTNETSLSCTAPAYNAILAEKNNEAKREQSPCNRTIYWCGINSEEEKEEENMDVVVATEKRPTC